MDMAKAYLRLALLYNVPYLNPSPINLCMFLQFMANEHSSISSIKNYFSGACTWVMEHRGNIQSFISPEISVMYKGLLKKLAHKTVRAAPLSYDHIVTIVKFIDSFPSLPPALKPCILIRYSCYLRASNLLTPSASSCGGAHTLLTRDLVRVGSSLIVTLNSTKTMSTPATLLVSPDPNIIACLVRAWDIYVNKVSLFRLGSAFLLYPGKPLTSDLLVSVMRSALVSTPDIDVLRLTLHSLRRGAVHNATIQGVEKEKIMKAGTWRSSLDIKPYLP